MSSTGPYSTQHVGVGASSGQNETPTEPTSHFILKNTKTKSIIVQTSHTKFAPKYGGGDLGPGDIVRIEIPSTGWFDPENSGLAFDFLIYTTSDITAGNLRGQWAPGTASGSWRWIRQKNGIQSIFNRVKLLMGTSNPIEDIHEYDILDKILLYATAPTDYVYNAGFILEGIHTGRDYWKQVMLNMFACSASTVVAGAGAVGVDQGHRYFVRPHIGLFRTGKFLPIGYMGMITLEFYLSQPNYCLIRSAGGSFVSGSNATPAAVVGAMGRNLYNEAGVNGTNFAMTSSSPNIDFKEATYRLKNVYWHCFFINPLEEFNNQVKTKLENGGTPIKIPTDVFRYHAKQVAGAWQGQQTVTIQERVASLKGVISVMINEGDRACPFRELTFHHNDIDEYRWRIAETYYPNQSVQCGNGGVEAYLEMQRTFGLTGDVFATNLINYENFRPSNMERYSLYEAFERKCPVEGTVHSDRFILAHNFEESLGQFSGVDLLRMNSDIELTYKLNRFTPAYANETAVGGPERMFAITPEQDWSVATGRKVLMPPPIADGLAVVGMSGGTGPWRFQINGGAIGDNLTGALTLLKNNLAVPLSMAAARMETNGFSSVVPCYMIGNQGNVNAIQDLTNANWEMVNIATHCANPGYYEWVFYTHFDQIVILETFGTVSVTTDIFNVI